MKRQKIYLIIACLLAVLSVLAIVYKQGGFRRSLNTQKLSAVFAIKDTGTITRVFLADMYGRKTLLSKEATGWMVNNSKPASEMKVKEMIATLTSIRVAQPIAKAGHRNIIERMAVTSTKVEVYETKPLFTLFGYPFFTKERLIKTYFFGDATQNSLGSYALVEGMAEPYIIYKPGFRGYVTPEFSPNPFDWYSHLIFNTKLTRIQKASFVDIENPENSFFVEKAGPRTFNLFDVHNNPLMDYDTTRLINMLSEFRSRYYEIFYADMSKSLKDSIIQFNFFKMISITDVEDKTTALKLYYQIDSGSLYENEELIEEEYHQLNKDRCYATFNDNTDEIYSIQFLHFDRQIQPLSYYLKK